MLPLPLLPEDRDGAPGKVSSLQHELGLTISHSPT